MRIAFMSVLAFLWAGAASAAQSGCLEPGDSEFVYPIGNIIKYCGDQRADNSCGQYLCTRCQGNAGWSDDYVCSKPDRVMK